MSNLNYVMKGNSVLKELDLFHLIVAPSFDCNLNCRHCYNLRDNCVMDFNTIVRLADEWEKICLSKKKKGIFHLKGGEPFMLSYLYDVVKYIKSKKFNLMITTNGTIQDKFLLDELANFNTMIIVSLDGHCETINSCLRRAGNFAKTVQFIKELKRRKILFHINCVLHCGNVNYIDDFLKLSKKLGAIQVNFLQLIARGAGKDLEENIVSLEKLNKKLSDSYQLLSNKEIMIGNTPYLQEREDISCCECVAGYKGLLYIKPNGEVNPCPNILGIIGNIYQKSLQGILQTMPNIARYKGICRAHCENLLNPDNCLSKNAYCFARNW